MDLAISGPSQSGGRMRKSETIVREIKRRLEKRRKDRKLEVMCKKKLLKRLKDGDDSQYREELKELNNQINDINNKVMDARENQTQARQSRLSKISITANLLYQYEDVKENEKRTKTRLDSCMKDLETVRSKINARQEKVRQDLAKFEEDLQQVEAAEENIRLQRQQSRDTMDRHEQNLRAASDRLNNLCNQKKKVEFEIQVISKSDSNLAVYGSTIVRIVEEINKQQNQFCQKPIGPLGLYIKVKDQNETAAVVNFLDESMLSAFCVDNDEDFVVLNNILKAVCQDDQQPTIYCSKFLPQKHKIEGHETETNHFMNLASMLEIDNPVVFNCLVDQLDDHTTLSIPPNEEEEYPLFEDEHQIAFTETSDTFFPAPNYKSFSSLTGVTRARFLQGNQQDIIRSLEEESAKLNEDVASKQEEVRSAQEEIKNASDFLNRTEVTAHQLKVKRYQLSTEIDWLRDMIDHDEDEGFERCLVQEMEKLQDKLEQETKLSEEMRRNYEQSKNDSDEAKRVFEEIQNTIIEEDRVKCPLLCKINQLESKIQNISRKKDLLKEEIKQCDRKLTEIDTEISELTEKLDQNTEEASQVCEPVRTRRKRRRS